MALPFFAVFGNVVYQNLFWLLIFFLFSKKYLGNTSIALLLLWHAALSLGVFHSYVVGSDLVASGIYVPFLLSMLCLSLESQPVSRVSFFWAFFFGISLSSRATHLLTLPLSAAFVWRHSEPRKALSLLVCMAAGFLGTTLPFYVYDPGGFSPLKQQMLKLDQFRYTFLPYPAIMVFLAAMAVSCFLAFKDKRTDLKNLLTRCAAVEILPILSAVTLATWQSKKMDFGLSTYALHSLFFALLGLWKGALEPAGKEGSRNV